MKTSLLRRTSAVAIAALTLALGAASATADDIYNTLDGTIDTVAEVMPLTVGGGNRTTTLRVSQTDDDGQKNCNLTASTTLTVSLASSDESVATVSPSSLTFTNCGAPHTVTVTPVAVGSVTVTLSQTSTNTTPGTFNLAPATFQVNVTAATPTNTAPTVDVVGVTGGTAYEVGSVPAASCSVKDTEDGDSTHAATLSEVTGPLASFGLGLQTATCSYTDLGGLKAVSSMTYSIVDTTAPVITLVSRFPEANGAGWNNSAVTLTWSCTDRFPFSASDLSETLSNDGADQSATGSCTDLSGNTATHTVSNIDIDTVAPTITASIDPEAPASGWWNISTGAPTVSYECNDGLSGVDTCTDAHLFGEGEDLATTGTVTDLAGNTASTGVSGVNVDLTAPVITRVSRVPAANGAGWNNSDVTATWSCSDLHLDEARTTRSVTVTTDGADQSATGTCTDVAGNAVSDTVGSINIDTVDPTITATLGPARPGTGWWNATSEAPTVTYDCNDGLSGVDTCTDAHTFGEGEDQAHSGEVTDRAGNTATAGVTDVDVDLTAPGVTWVGGPADGASYYFGSVPAAGTCVATDGLSGPGACVVAGYATTVGPQALTATSLDLAGNTTAQTRTYTVKAWTLGGFFQPVDLGTTVWNTVKGGSTVPLKFEVFAGATELTDKAVIDTFTVKGVACPGTGVTTDDIELVTTGATELRYDAVAGQFIQNWQTPKKPGACYTVTMTTDDGSSTSANFKLK